MGETDDPKGAEMTINQEPCLNCGLPQDHQAHNARKPPPEGWHPFRGLAYLDALEDEGGVCFGNRQAELAKIAAHNRRAVKHWGGTK